MPLNKCKGNMFSFVTHTWNPIRGKCYHDCKYCYMKAMSKRFNLDTQNKPAYFDKKELKTNLGRDNFIFICSSNDLFAENIESDWIQNTFCKAISYKDNHYLLQTKNPKRYLPYLEDWIYPHQFVLSTTIESNYFYPRIMNKSPEPIDRALAMAKLPKIYRRMVTIEPIMAFDLAELVAMIMSFNPDQINIGANTNLQEPIPEPTAKETLKLIEVLEKYKTVVKKSNLKRILKSGERIKKC